MPQTTEMPQAFGLMFCSVSSYILYLWLNRKGIWCLILSVKILCKQTKLAVQICMAAGSPPRIFVYLFTTGKIKRAKDYQIQANKAQRGKIRSLYHLCDILPLQRQCLSVERRWNILSINSKYFKHWSSSSMRLNFGILCKNSTMSANNE